MLNDTNITENADDSLMDCVMLEGNDNSELDTVMSVDGDKEKVRHVDVLTFSCMADQSCTLCDPNLRSVSGIWHMKL